jgi:membrane protein implicated in regulation of membrane protease activity
MLADGFLDLGIDLEVWPWVWLGVAVVFALIELTLLGGSFVLLPFSISAFIASILGFYDVPVEVQWIVFLVGGALLFAAALKWLRRFVDDNDTPPGVGANRLIGMTGIVTESITPDDVARGGRVSIASEVWGAEVRSGSRIERGSKVRVVDVEGTRVIVEVMEPSPPGDQEQREQP